VSRKRLLSSRSVERLGERERAAGLDPADDAARWLEEHDPVEPPAVPKSVRKNKTLHQWRKRTRQ
jgi:hypothetical protein